MAEKTAKELLEEARKNVGGEVNAALANDRLTLLKRLDELEDVHIEDDGAKSLRVILGHYSDGITLTRLSVLFPDPAVLAKARKAMAKELEESKKGRLVTLKLKPVPPPSQ